MDAFDDHTLPRRGFLQAGAAGAVLLCTIGGKRVALRTPEDGKRADALARAVAAPQAAKDPVDKLTFGTPQPQPGGTAREYWRQARGLRWDVAPPGRDDWQGQAVPRPHKFLALAYQPMTAGFAKPVGPATIPGPTLTAEVGDTIVVHFRNEAESLGQALTVRPHGVRYTPDYDGAYLGDYTRAGGF